MSYSEPSLVGKIHSVPQTTMQVTLPEMGESVTEGTIAKWLKQPGDQVREGEGLVEVTTDKVDAEVPAPASGTLVKILAEAGKTVAVGAALAEIAVGADGDVAAKKPATPEAVAKPAVAKPAAAQAQEPLETRSPVAAPSAPPNGGKVTAPVEVSEGAELLAKAKGIDLATIKGSGPGGAIRRRDVAGAVGRDRQAGPPPPPPPPKNHHPTPPPTRARRKSPHPALPRKRGRGKAPGDTLAGRGRRPREVHGGKPPGADRNQLPHGAGRRARSAAAPAQPEHPGGRTSREDLLHPPDRLRDHARGQGRPIDGGDL